MMNEWIKVKEQLPELYERVLVYTRRKDIGIGYLIDRPDVPLGEFWNINGASGGYGTCNAVKPPIYWMALPKIPNCEY